MTQPLAITGSTWTLVRSCARFAAGIGAATDVADAAMRTPDWPNALGVARDQGLGGLLARALQKAEAPEPLRASAHEAVAVSGARTLGQIRLLTRIWRTLADAGVPSLPYKGPVLSLQLYGDATLRSSVDLDLVVARASYSAARESMLRLGLPPRSGHSARQERTLFRWLGSASFGHGTEEFVELHWRFAPLQFPFGLTPERAFARAERVQLAGQSIPAMARDDLVVTLAMHGARHLYERLEWLTGVTRLLLTSPQTVSELLAHARALRGRRMLLVSAALAIRVLDAPLRSEWGEAIRSDGEADRIASELERVMPGPNCADPQPDGVALQHLYARMLDSRADRARSVLRAALLPTMREWETIRLPDALTPLYHVIRPARLLLGYVGRATGRSST